MASKTISITHTPGGVPTDYDSVPYLRDATAAYGVRLAASPYTVALAPTALTRTSAGAYTITVTGLTASTTYQYAIERTYLGATTRTVETFTVADSTPAAGFWTTQAKVESEWGDVNVDVDSALSGTTGPDVPVIQAAVDEVDRGIDRLCRVYGWDRPDPDDSDDYGVVSDLATTIVRAKLARRRGDSQQQGPGAAQYAKLEAQAWAELEAMLEPGFAEEGVDFPRLTAVPANAPVAVYPTVDREGRTILPVNASGYGWPWWDAASGAWRNW